MKTNWNELVKSRMKTSGITQSDLAELMGVAQGTIARYLNEKREPSLDTIAEMMKHVGLSQMTLLSDGSVTPDGFANVKSIDDQPETKGLFPLISSVQAGQWREACEPYNVKDAQMLATTEKASSSSFWLTVEGDSMTAPPGSPLSFPTGVRVLVDPEVEAVNKSLVVAKLDDVNEATFKQLIIDAGQKFLSPLNPSFPKLPINGNCKIVGVVVDAKIDVKLT
ncbi:helix-turn-helix domain-containing protein [Vibrio parahaemolyticus]|nr:helix-turn-helix domain-containing protein [Vibrio parahaemolyticus]EGQ9447847.1 helix-turn-helix domain-containing protein [Vibrio parahaemolyticus]EGQ9533684.1 helix-turn-helix domain-containing protein [Vibrio parahaemolyticus]EHY0972946.1 helix-turn-helix domain-containing protein [Vibrio parahaemolyticus]EHZ7339865.1 helix-turn-helix domain-containing protein [Vibrio parahaemolyticus]